MAMEPRTPRVSKVEINQISLYKSCMYGSGAGGGGGEFLIPRDIFSGETPIWGGGCGKKLVIHEKIFFPCQTHHT